MAQGGSKACRCAGSGEIVADLVEHDLLELKPGEKLWKLYCFKDSSHPTELRHRIYTKKKADGRLAMLTFAVHNPPRQEPGGHEGDQAPEVLASPPVRSALARVPDLSPTDLDRLIGVMKLQAQSGACEELDLSRHDDLEAQLAWLLAEDQ